MPARKKTTDAMAKILAGQDDGATANQQDGEPAGHCDEAPERRDASEPAQDTKTKETYRIATDLAEALNRAWLQRKMLDRSATKSAMVEEALRAYLGLGE